MENTRMSRWIQTENNSCQLEINWNQFTLKLNVDKERATHSQECFEERFVMRLSIWLFENPLQAPWVLLPVTRLELMTYWLRIGLDSVVIN